MLGYKTGDIITPNKALMVTLALLMAGALCIGAAPGADAEGETYTIEYAVDGQAYSYTGASEVVALKTLADLGASVPEGLQFDAWIYADSPVRVMPGSLVTLTANAPGEDNVTTFTATFVAVEYIVQFIVDGVVVSETVGALGDAVTVPDDPAKDGYVFAGWDADVPETLAESVTITALWTEIHAVTWYVEDVNVASGTTESIVAPADPVKENYRFLGWYDADGAKYNAQYIFTADTVFTAEFAAEVYTVTFVYGEEGEVFLFETVAHGDPAIEPASLPEGYSGWAWDFTKPITGDVTVTAVETAPAAPALWDTSIGQCAIIIVVFLIGLFLWAVYTGKITLPKFSVVRKG